MQARAARLRGRTRLHEPTADEPLIVVVVDELASLTAYAERDDRRRITAALSLLLSQGRAVGVVVVAALQDPRKEVLPFRDLFPTRIALALVEAEQTDLVLGRGARVRGRGLLPHPAHHPGDRVGVVRRRTRTRPGPGRLGHRRRHRRHGRAYTPGTARLDTVDDGRQLDLIDLTDPPRRRSVADRGSVGVGTGLLHVLAAIPGRVGAGSRAEEAKKSRRGCRVPRLGWDFFAVPLTQTGEPVTLAGRREGARPPQGAAA